jgi:hypothetical protein
MKITVIIPTSESPLSCFIRSISSLIINSDLDRLDQIIVSINGPDARTGDTSVQDKKQEFCNELKSSGVPITVVRTWSRIGYSAPIEICTSLIRTEFYLLMHDDVLVTDKKWQNEFDYWRTDKDVDALVALPVLSNKLLTRMTGLLQKNREKPVSNNIFFPTINTVFSIFRTSSNLIWKDYNFEINSSIDVTYINSFFENIPKSVTLLPGEVPDRKEPNDSFSRIIYGRKARPKGSSRFRKWRCVNTKGTANKFSYKVGSWAFYQIASKNKKIAHFSKVTHHIENMNGKETKIWESENPDLDTRLVIDRIESSNLEKNYSNNVKKLKGLNSLDIRPLICVQVYDRVEDISYWINAWKKSMKFGGKLLVAQNYDDTPGSKETTKIIKELNPDYHWMRPNDKQLLHIFEILEGKFEIDFDWNIMFSFIDDIKPLRKDFLWPLMYQFSDPNVGITGGYRKRLNKDYDPKKDPWRFGPKGADLAGKYSQRDVALAIRREALEKVNKQILNEQIKKRSDFSYLFENRIGEWVESVGYSWVSTDYQWPFVFGWDIDNNVQEDLFDKAYANIEDYNTGVYDLI